MSLGVAVAGLGSWGPNLARTFDGMNGCELRWCVDVDPAAEARMPGGHKATRFTTRFEDVLADPELAAVAICTPVSEHAPMAMQALEAGKHCLVEKPMAASVEDAERVAAAAEARDLTLMAGHLLCYHPAVRRLSELVDAGELGEILYIHSQRLNLGKLRVDENALLSLGAHDLSVLLELTSRAPTEVTARGGAFVRPEVEDIVFALLRFGDGVLAHMHLSWLDPHKTRRITVVGSERMATFDDMALDRKLTVYDRGFEPDASSYGEYITRSGTSWNPEVPSDEPLRLECEEFIESIVGGVPPRTGAVAGVEVVRVLAALQASLRAGGLPRAVSSPLRGREA